MREKSLPVNGELGAARGPGEQPDAKVPLQRCQAFRHRLLADVEMVRGEPELPLVRDGDEITLDVTARRLDVALSDEELAARAAEYEPYERPYPGPALAKYARLVSSAAEGAITR